jgi:putative pyruvate formate lyase activating enzyme
MSQPSYLRLLVSGELEERAKRLHRILGSCELCPRKCRVNRIEGETGYCGSGKDLTISSYGPHFGEEAPLVGRNRLVSVLSGFGVQPTGGSGTIFLTHCNLLCVYCQNFEISHLKYGRIVSETQVAEYALELQERGCHNINFVTPTHFAPQIVNSIKIAAERGLHLPVVWNCGGYENVRIIELLEGIVDIYMPDIKYSSSSSAEMFSDAADYFTRCKESVKEMYRQVGDLKQDENGVAERGLLIRHLVLPNDLAGSEEVLRFIAEELSRNTFVNVMSQYRPEGRAHHFEELNRRPTQTEFTSAIEIACQLQLTRGLQDKHLNRF